MLSLLFKFDGREEEERRRDRKKETTFLLNLSRSSSTPPSSLLLQNHRLLQQVGHRLRRLCSDGEPLLDGGRVQVGLFAERVVEAQPLERSPLAPVARVDCDEPVKGRFFAAEALEADGDLGLHEERGVARGSRRGGRGALSRSFR